MTGYKIHYRRAGGGGDGSVMVNADSTSVEISGLTSTETYLFSVQATTNTPNTIILKSEERSLQLSECFFHKCTFSELQWLKKGEYSAA